MFYAAPTHVLAIFQFPTDQEMALQISADPEVVFERQELRDALVASEDKRGLTVFEQRRVEASEYTSVPKADPRNRR